MARRASLAPSMALWVDGEICPLNSAAANPPRITPLASPPTVGTPNGNPANPPALRAAEIEAESSSPSALLKFFCANVALFITPETASICLVTARSDSRGSDSESNSPNFRKDLLIASIMTLSSSRPIALNSIATVSFVSAMRHFLLGNGRLRPGPSASTFVLLANHALRCEKAYTVSADWSRSPPAAGQPIWLP